MLPLSITLFGVTIPTFTALIAAAVLVCAGIMVRALTGILSRACLIDVLLIMLLGGMIGARIEHVALAWDHFAGMALERVLLPTRDGGLGWHGGVIGGLSAVLIGARVLNVTYAIPRVLAALAPAVALIGAAGWIGCWAHGCAYGREVDTLAQFEAAPFIVHEARDVYGLVAPRYATPLFGVMAALIAVTPLIFVRHRSARRLWIALALFAVCMFMIGFFRGDSVPQWFGLRADQVLDSIMVLFALVCGKRSSNAKNFL